MLYENVLIKGLEVYHPEHSIENDYFMEHFASMGLDPSGFMQGMGRKRRYLDIDGKDNSLSMAIKASEKAIIQSGIKVSEIDMIIFVSDTPEYLIPSNALLIKEAIGATSANVVHDHNANCIGMISAIDHASRYMKGNKRIRNAMVVGSFYSEMIAREDCPLSYPTFGDGSCAVILNKVKEERERGVIDTVYSTVSNHTGQMVYPANGFSNLMSANADPREEKLVWKAHDVSFFIDVWEELIRTLALENNILLNQISQFYFSQISSSNIENMVARLDTDAKQAPYSGDEYGYTACTSPFIAYYHNSKQRNKRPVSEKYIFCSVGAGYSMGALLYSE
jgi:3-oxoacyl-[acyl-carrier-protein] synthase III